MFIKLTHVDSGLEFQVAADAIDAIDPAGEFTNVHFGASEEQVKETVEQIALAAWVAQRKRHGITLVQFTLKPVLAEDGTTTIPSSPVSINPDYVDLVKRYSKGGSLITLTGKKDAILVEEDYDFVHLSLTQGFEEAPQTAAKG